MPPADAGAPQTPTRPAIPMPSGENRAAEPRPDEHPRRLPDDRPADRPDNRTVDLDPALGLRPESLARLGEADLDLLAKLQAELRSGRSGRADDHAAPGPPRHPGVDGTGINGTGINGTGINGTARNGYPHGPTGTGAHRPHHGDGTGGIHGTGANGAVSGTGQFGTDRDGTDRSSTDRNGTGSTRNGSRRNPFSMRRKRQDDGSGDDGPPDIAG
jgi:hypothetical protein